MKFKMAANDDKIPGHVIAASVDENSKWSSGAMKFKMAANDDEIPGHVVRPGVKGHLSHSGVITSRTYTIRRHPLFRTRKGPEILFELANVRINRS